ncbi:unnamed protein product [Rhodiola kirilowii]
MPRSTVSCWSYQNASFATLLNIMTILPLRHKLFTAARTANRPARSRVGQQEKWRMKRLRSLTSFYSGFSGTERLQACNSDKGFGIYTSADAPEDGVLLVVPLDLAITPMRVLQDPVVGLECRKLFEDGDGDDRFFDDIVPDSGAPAYKLFMEAVGVACIVYLDMLPTSFGNPLWFTDDEIEELKGTALYRASKLQNAEMRCLLSRHLLAGGFFPVETSQNDCNSKAAKVSNYSWSGKRRMPSYLSKLVFPEDFLTALRTISMKEEQLYQVSSMLEELVGSEDRQLLETEVRTAVWEACGDSGAFQLLVDLLQTKMMALEEGSGTEDF